MYNSKIIGDLIRRYGCNINVTNGDKSKSYNAFIQPLRYKNKIYLDGTALSQGMYDGSHSLLIAPPELELNQPLDDYVIECASMGRRFCVRKFDIYYFNDRPIYVWAILGSYSETEVP